MSEQRQDPGLDELSARLDAAFAAARPRRGFDDELWGRLQQRAPWWRRLGRLTVVTPWPALGAVVTVLAIGLMLLVVPRPGAAPTTRPSLPAGGALPATSDGSARVPAPPAQAVAPAAPASSNGGAAALVFAVPPLGVPVRLAVYRYALGEGAPASGEVPARAPTSTTEIGSFATRSVEEAERQAIAAAAGQGAAPTLTLTSVELVYVAVATGSYGYLEPAYLFSGKLESGGQTYDKRVLLPALAQSATR